MEILIYGITSFLSQIILIRECLTTFQAGEILIVFIISIWLITTSVSSYLSKKLLKIEPSRIKYFFHLISPLILSLQILTIKSKNILTPLGEDINIWFSFIISFIATIQYTILSGMYFQKTVEEDEKIKIKKIYLLDCLGFIIGSIFFYIFSEIIKPTQILSIVLIINTTVIIKKTSLYKIIFIFAISMLLINKAYQINPVSKKLIEYYNTKYGKIEVYKIKEQIYLYYNSQRIFDPSDRDIILREAISSIVFSKKHESIACLSNDAYLCQTIAELTKGNIYYIHPDKKLIEIQERIFGSLLDIQKIYKNPLNYFINSKKKFDLIVMKSTLPSTIAETTLFSKPYIENILNNLNEKHGLYVNIIPFPKTPNSYQKKALSTYFTILKENFNNVEVFYDEFLLIVSSKNEIKANNKLKDFSFYIKYLFENKVKIDEIKEKKFFSIYKLNLLSELTKSSPKISDYLSKTSRYINLVLITMLIFIIKYLEKKSLEMLFASFSSLFCQYSIIALYQIKYGYLYKDITLIFLTVMIGLYLGINSNFMLKKLFYPISFLAIAFFPILIINKIILILSILITSFISGNIFKETSYTKGIMSYVFDYLGAFLAIIIFNVWIFNIENIRFLLLPLVISSFVFIINK